MALLLVASPRSALNVTSPWGALNVQWICLEFVTVAGGSTQRQSSVSTMGGRRKVTRQTALATGTLLATGTSGWPLPTNLFAATTVYPVVLLWGFAPIATECRTLRSGSVRGFRRTSELDRVVWSTFIWVVTVGRVHGVPFVKNTSIVLWIVMTSAVNHRFPCDSLSRRRDYHWIFFRRRRWIPLCWRGPAPRRLECLGRLSFLKPLGRLQVLASLPTR